MAPKLTPLLLIFLGEALAILAEVVAAKYFLANTNKYPAVFMRALPIMILAALLLLSGYMLGLRNFKNIWVVSSISIASILIVEPIIDYAVMRQLPTRGAFIGLICGVCGIFATLLL